MNDGPLARAEALLAAGRYAEAEAGLAEAARAAPGDAGPPRTLGHLLLQRGAWAEAEGWLACAHRLVPEDVHVAFDLAWCCVKLERPGEAVTLLEGLPPSPAGQHLLGRALLTLGEGQAARGALMGCGLPAADLELGWAHWVCGDARAATATWERWMRAGAADWGTKDALATFLFLLGGGARPGGRPERPAEPVRHLTEWLRWLVRHGRSEDVDTALLRGPRLDPGLWDPLRRSWAQALRALGEDARAQALRP